MPDTLPFTQPFLFIWAGYIDIFSIEHTLITKVIYNSFTVFNLSYYFRIYDLFRIF